jgi:hypothetical protein
MKTSTIGITGFLSALGIVALGCSGAPTESTGESNQASQTTTGNGGPSGSHYDLNLIGVSQGKTASMTGSNTHVIFVPLDGSCQINLVEGSFGVLDGNCTDGTAEFELPNPDPTNSGTTTYSVYARALGTPGGSSTTQTCATDPTTGQVYCSTQEMVLIRAKNSKFTNVSQQLLYIYTTINGKSVRIPLFDSTLQNYFWQYDNNGLKNAQLRFYPVSTTVAAP